jgi:hypothetical protein
MRKKGTLFYLKDNGSLTHFKQMCVPEGIGLRKEIMSEAHCSSYIVYPGSTKMYKDVKESYWWNNMKLDIASFMEQCSTYQRVKAKR